MDSTDLSRRAKVAIERFVRSFSAGSPRQKIRPAWTVEAEQAARRGTTYRREEGDGYTLASYEKEGELDYDTYRLIQETGNKEKLTNVFTTEEVVALVAKHAGEKLGLVGRVLCHGTRNGTEQQWFKAHFPAAEVLGTEISSTAVQFPMTIQWDFHEIKDGWDAYWDVLYSNSWDHSFSPARMFSAWARSLRPGGFLYLEHTPEHQVVDDLDLFGATPGALQRIVEESGLAFAETLFPPRSGEFERSVLVFRKS